MKKQIDFDRVCAYCERSHKVYDADNVLCEKRGIVDAGYCCRLFSYDLLKRSPRRAKIEKDFDLSDADGI